MAAESQYLRYDYKWDVRDAVIPTDGAAGTVVDQYAVVSVQHTDLPTIGATFTDVAAMVALSKVAEGGLGRVEELEAAETALQAILLHEQAHVILAAPKVINTDANFGFYSRPDEAARTEYCFKLQGVSGGRDWMIAPELLTVHRGKVSTSSKGNSPLIGRALGGLDIAAYWEEHLPDAINAAIRAHKVAGYLADPRMQSTRHDRGFAKALYKRIRVPWNKVIGDVPPVEIMFDVPPLLAVALDRLGDRDRSHLIDVIAELRAELVDARQHLRDLDQLATSSQKQAELEGQIKRVSQSFDAIIPESRLTGVERRQRLVARVYRPARKILGWAAAFVGAHGQLPLNEIEEMAKTAHEVLSDETIVERNVTAKTFAGMFSVLGPLQDVVRDRLSNEEIFNIEGSIKG